MTDITVLTVPVFSALCNEGFRLRREVFVIEQKVPPEEEFDADDLTASHVVAIVRGDVCGTLRVIAAEHYMKIGRVVTGMPWRGMGVASALMRHALAEHGEKRAGRFHLAAQSDKMALYQRFGFKAYGNEFLDVGIPHFNMKNF